MCDKHDGKIIQRLEKENVEHPTLIDFYDNDSLETMKSIVENGFDPKSLTRTEVDDYMRVSGRIAIFADCLDKLCKMGIPLDIGEKYQRLKDRRLEIDTFKLSLIHRWHQTPQDLAS